MSFIFTILAISSLIFALLVVNLRHLFYATLALAGFLLCIAGLYISLFAEFLAIAQIIVYVGAVVVLILFLLMITGYRREEVPLKEAAKKRKLPALLFTLIFAFILLFIFHKNLPTGVLPPPYFIHTKINPTEDFAYLLMSRWLVPFELISILLLVALVGAIGLLKKKE